MDIKLLRKIKVDLNDIDRQMMHLETKAVLEQQKSRLSRWARKKTPSDPTRTLALLEKLAVAIRLLLRFN